MPDEPIHPLSDHSWSRNKNGRLVMMHEGKIIGRITTFGRGSLKRWFFHYRIAFVESQPSEFLMVAHTEYWRAQKLNRQVPTSILPYPRNY